MSKAVVFTGNMTYVYMWLARKYSCKLEATGMRHSSGRSVRALCKKQLGLKRNATLDEICAAIATRCEKIASGERQEM